MSKASTGLQSILLSVFFIVGAIGAGVAFDRYRNRATGAAVARSMAVPAAQQDRFARMIDEEMGPLLNGPEFRQALTRQIGPGGTDAQARAFGQQLTQHGIARLPLHGLDEITRLRLVLATHSEAMCAGLWSGNQPQAVAAALASLSDDDLRQWLRVSTEAARLELNATQPLVPDREALVTGLRQIEALATDAERANLESAMQAGVGATPASGCMAIRTILSTTPRLEPGLRERFLRAFAAM